MRDDDFKIYLHANRDEKKSEQYVSKRRQIGFYLVFILGFCDEHARDECAQRIRKAKNMRQKASPHDGKKDGRDENFFRICPYNVVEEAVESKFAEHEKDHYHYGGAYSGF